jgi:hypothetical protein
MTLLVSIGLGLLGVAAVVLIHGVAGDVLGGLLVIGALVSIIRSVIPLAGEAGTQGEISPGPGSSREATSRPR